MPTQQLTFADGYADAMQGLPPQGEGKEYHSGYNSLDEEVSSGFADLQPMFQTEPKMPRATKPPVFVEHYESSPNGVDLTYVIVNPTADKGSPQTRWDPGSPPSVEWDNCYLKGDPTEADATDADPSLAERVEATLWAYFEKQQAEEEEAYHEERMRRING